jgi:hypothetical protein
MKVSDLIKSLQSLKPELQYKDIFIIAKNGLLVSPEIKFSLKDPGSLDKTKENVDYIVLN